MQILRQKYFIFFTGLFVFLSFFPFLSSFSLFFWFCFFGQTHLLEALIFACFLFISSFGRTAPRGEDCYCFAVLSSFSFLNSEELCWSAQKRLFVYPKASHFFESLRAPMCYFWISVPRSCKILYIGRLSFFAKQGRKKAFVSSASR